MPRISSSGERLARARREGLSRAAVDFFISASLLLKLGDVGLVDDLDAGVDDAGRPGCAALAASPLVASSCIHLRRQVAELERLLHHGRLRSCRSRWPSSVPSSSSNTAASTLPFLPRPRSPRRSRGRCRTRARPPGSGRECALTMSSTLERALARSVLSSRLSTISMLWPAMAASMPLRRWAALSAEKRADEHRHLAALRQQLDDLARRAPCRPRSCWCRCRAGAWTVGASESNVMSLLLAATWSSTGTWSFGAITLTAMRVVALARQVLEDLVLLLGRAVGRHLHVDLDLALLLVLADAGARRSSRTRSRCW